MQDLSSDKRVEIGIVPCPARSERAGCPWSPTTTWLALGLFSLALLLRVLFVSWAVITPISDAERYLGHAVRLLAGEGYVGEDGTLTSYTPPLYPAFVAGVYALAGPRVRAVGYVQAVLGALSCVLLFLVSRRAFGGRVAALAGMLLAVSPTALVYAADLETEVLAAFLLLCAVALVPVGAWRRPWASTTRVALAGLVTAAALLCRPALVAWAGGLTLGLGVLPALTWRRRVLVMLSLALAVLVGLAPWTCRNWRVHRRLVFISTNGGVVLLMGNNPKAYSGGYMTMDGGAVPERRANEVDVDRHAARLALRWMAEHPWGYARVSARRLLGWVSTRPDYVPGTRLTSSAKVDKAIIHQYRARWEQGRAVPEEPVARASRRANYAILFAWSVLIVPLAALGIGTDLVRMPKWYLLAPLAVYVLALSLSNLHLRYKEVVMPLLLMYAAVGANALPALGRLREELDVAHRPRATLVLLFGCSAMLLFCLQLCRDWDVVSFVFGHGR